MWGKSFSLCDALHVYPPIHVLVVCAQCYSMVMSESNYSHIVHLFMCVCLWLVANILSLSAFCTTRAFALKHLCQLRSYHGTGIRLLHLVSFEYLD